VINAIGGLNVKSNSIIRTVAVVFVLLCVLLQAGEADAATAGTIRAALVSGAETLSFKVSGNYEIVDLATGKVLSELKQGETCQVELKGSRIAVQGSRDSYGSFKGPVAVRESGSSSAVALNGSGMVKNLSLEKIMAVSGDGKIVSLKSIVSPAIRTASGTIQFKGSSSGLNLISLSSSSGSKRYRGSVEFCLEKGKLTAVNVLNIEDYLRGVVPSEMPSSWSPEALKAQAVAARNYALQSVETTRGAAFNVNSDISSQVYGGYDAETAAANKAVEETRGIVMLSGGSVVSAFFHSSSGGCTEDSEDVWSGKVSYIRSKEDPYDKNEKHYNWKVSYTAEQLKEVLAAAGYKFKKVTDVLELERTSSGARVMELAVKGVGLDGKSLTVEIKNADKVRAALGLKSALFKSTKKFDRSKNLTEISITGSGWGHGLGMSQYGARGMAMEGYDYQEILQYYYSGINFADDYGR
jgi:stage II sporulation protein D